MNTVRKLHHLNAWERTSHVRTPGNIPAGCAALAELLPAGGWPRRGLAEITVPAEDTDVRPLIMPVLARFGRQARWLGMVAPPYSQRVGMLSDTDEAASRLLQINPHAGRSGLWTMEQMLRSGNFSMVMAWPSCAAGLMAQRLHKAAAAGNALGLLFRVAPPSGTDSRIDARLELEADGAGQVVYRLDRHGNRIAGAVLVS